MKLILHATAIMHLESRGQMIMLASFAWLVWGGSRCGSPRNLFYSRR